MHIHLHNSQKMTLSALWVCLCVLFTIDTGQFLYPSLSQTLLGEMVTTIIAIVFCVYLISKYDVIDITKFDLFICLWVFYLVMHSIFLADAEHYKLRYLICTLLLVLVLSKIIKLSLLNSKYLEYGVLFMLIVQLAYLVLQTIGLMVPYSKLYKLTGAGDNPNVAAILLAMSIPVIIRKTNKSNHVWLYMSLLLLTIIYVLVLKCRTAYVGLLIMTIVHVTMHSNVRNSWKTLSNGRKTMFIIAIPVIMIITAVTLYNMKKESADGRLLVWKLSTRMIVEKPLGHGIGMFERCYNTVQGEYFASGQATQGEAFRSAIVGMAYNDFLEQGVESGLLGTAFLLSFYLSLIYKAYRIKDIESLSMICAFFVMSMINFIYSTMQPWILFLGYAANIMAKDKAIVKISKAGSIPISFVSLIAFAVIGVNVSNVAIAQHRLKLESDKIYSKNEGDMKLLLDMKEHIGTSSEYYQIIAKVSMKNCDYNRALRYLNEASKYSAAPSIYFDRFKCLDKLGRVDDGIEHIKEISNILPQNLASKAILLNWFHTKGLKEEALCIAHVISEMPVKIQNKNSKAIQSRASLYIKENE